MLFNKHKKNRKPLSLFVLLIAIFQLAVTSGGQLTIEVKVTVLAVILFLALIAIGLAMFRIRDQMISFDQSLKKLRNEKS